MTPRRKSLLEVFQSVQAPRTPAPTGNPVPSPGPKAAPSTAAPSLFSRAERSREASSWMLGVHPLVFVLVGLGLAFVLGMAVGRSSMKREALAQEGGEPQAEDSADPALRGSVGGELGSANGARPSATPPSGGLPNAALLDAANRYTIVAATYGKSKVEYARATYRHMKDQGLPVFEPVERDKNIVVLVGAAPKKAALDDVERRVKALEGFDGTKGAYADAYPQLIDELIRR